MTNWTAESEHVHGDMLRFEYNWTFIILASDGILFLHKTPGRKKEPPLTVVKTTGVTFENCVKCVSKEQNGWKSFVRDGWFGNGPHQTDLRDELLSCRRGRLALGV